MKWVILSLVKIFFLLLFIVGNWIRDFILERRIIFVNKTITAVIIKSVLRTNAN